RQNRTPVHARPRDDGNFRAPGQRYIVISCDRIGEDAELELRLAVGLQTDARRAEPTVAESYRYPVARAQKILHHTDIERAAPGADIALELPLGLECRTVRGLHRCVALSHWISELNWSKVCCKAKPNLDGAGIVDAEGSSRIDQRQSLQRPRFQASRRRQ